MEENSSTKAWSLYHFVYYLTGGSRALFIVFYSILVLLCFGLIWISLDPYAWALHINPIPEEFSSAVVLEKVHAYYRNFDISMEAIGAGVTFGAEPLLPPSWLIIAFSIVQMIAWPLVMTTATRFANSWCYPVYLIFAILIYFSGWGEIIMPAYPHIFSGTVIIVFLLTAYLFHQNIIRLKLIPRYLIFLGMYMALYAWAWKSDSWHAWNAVASNGFLILLVVVIFYLFMIGNDLIQLVLFITVNRKEVSSRLSVNFFAILSGIILLWGFLLVQHFARWDLLPLKSILNPCAFSCSERLFKSKLITGVLSKAAGFKLVVCILIFFQRIFIPSFISP